MQSPAELAERAMLLEVAATPTAGNVDRERDLPDLRFEQFLAGASGARAGLEAIERGVPVGEGFETAVGGMAAAARTNTQFGSLLLLAPLVRAVAKRPEEPGDRLGPDAPSTVVAATTVEDAAAFYRAFEHVDVRVEDPPEEMEPLDVRRGADAIPAVRERGETLAWILEAASGHDDIAREWTEGFERTFDAADRLASRDGALVDRAARVHIDLLAEEPDTLVATEHGDDTATELCARAGGIDPWDGDAVRSLSSDLIERGINPGTTADILAGGLFVTLVREGGKP